MSTHHDTLALDTKVNDMIFSGKAMEAFEEFYAEDVVMQENTEPEYVGKAFNRKREQDFFATVEAWHGGGVTANAANGDVSFSESWMEVTLRRGHHQDVAVHRTPLEERQDRARALLSQVIEASDRREVTPAPADPSR